MTATKTPAFHKPPLFTRQQLIALLLPLIAEQALSVTIGLADTLMVSSVGEAAVSGVSLVDSFNTLMIQIMSALATGGAVVTSQYIGRQEPKDAKNPANKRYAYGEVMLTQNVGSWTTYTITLNVTDASVTPTHFLFVASSSYDGNHFNAVNGSEMRVDNVELVY